MPLENVPYCVEFIDMIYFRADGRSAFRCHKMVYLNPVLVEDRNVGAGGLGLKTFGSCRFFSTAIMLLSLLETSTCFPRQAEPKV